MSIRYKNTPIHYTKQGKGTPLVLLHGFLESGVMWDNFIPVWSENHTIITIDLLGHGKTGCTGYIHTMEEMAEAVLAVLKHENIETAIFTGHSMGGYVTLAIAEKYPEKVSSLILLNSTPRPDSPEKQENRERSIRLIKTNRASFIGMAISNLFAENNRERLQEEINKLKTEALQFPVQGIIAALEGMKIRKDRTKVLSRFSKPKFIIAGSKDPIMPVNELREIATQSNTVFYELDGGHMSTIENPEDLKKVFGEIL